MTDPPPIHHRVTVRRTRHHRISFRVRRIYFDAIVTGEKSTEVRRASPYWLAAVARIAEWNTDPAGPGGDDAPSYPVVFTGRTPVGVFLCGHYVHRREILGVRWEPSAEAALGRPPSEQGRADLGDGPVLVFKLGKEVER